MERIRLTALLDTANTVTNQLLDSRVYNRRMCREALSLRIRYKVYLYDSPPASHVEDDDSIILIILHVP